MQIHTHVLAHKHANIHACRHPHAQAHARMQTLFLFRYTLVDRTKLCCVTKPVSAASVAEEFSLQSFMRVLFYFNTATVLLVSITESVNIRNTAVCIHSRTLPRAPHRHSQSIHASIYSSQDRFLPPLTLPPSPMPFYKQHPSHLPTPCTSQQLSSLHLKETYIQIR